MEELREFIKLQIKIDPFMLSDEDVIKLTKFCLNYLERDVPTVVKDYRTKFKKLLK